MLNLRFRTVVFVLAVSLVSTACDSSDLSENDVSQLEDTQWNLIEIGDQSVSAENLNREPGLMFHSEEGSVSGSGGCNQLHGTYEADGETILFGQISTTLMACPEGMDIEQMFLGSLEAVTRWRLDHGQLEFLDSDGQLLMRLESVG